MATETIAKFLRASKGKGTDHKANKQTAGIAKENGRRVKIEAEEANDRRQERSKAKSPPPRAKRESAK